MKLILASQSPRRKQLLERLGIPFGIIVPNVDESQFQYGNSPEEYAQELSELKCGHVSVQYPNSLVIGSDTIVVLGNRILEKPSDMQDAKSMLKMLSGNTHTVISAVNFRCDTKNINHTFNEQTQVTFREIPDEYVTTYINSSSPYDKAGSYGIQDWSAIFVEKINGCYDNVVGFPLSRFVFELGKFGIKINELT